LPTVSDVDFGRRTIVKVDGLDALSSAMFLVDKALSTVGSFVFSRANVVACPPELTSNALVILKDRHDYNGYYEVDSLRLVAHRRTLRLLSLLILSSIFHGEPDRIHISLANPKSDVKHLVVESPHLMRLLPDLTLTPLEFSYVPAVVEKHPFVGLLPDLLVRDLPCFFLTLRDDVPHLKGSTKDTLVGFGTTVGHALLAELLLNASDPSNTTTEIHLESEAGFRGVGSLSAEATIVLPGSPAWIEP
jgi:hypothetical protein